MPAYSPSNYQFPSGFVPSTSADRDSVIGYVGKNVQVKSTLMESPGSVNNNHKEFWIAFKEQMNASYRVEIPPLFPFCNDRGPHVETPVEGLTGRSFKLDLRSRQVKVTDAQRGLVAVMYPVIDLDGAHFTNYHGPITGSDKY